VNRDEELFYEERKSEYYNKIISAGGFSRNGKDTYLYEKYQEFSKQPYYWFKREQWEGKRMKYAKSNVLAIVNSLFDCNFQEIEIDSIFLTTEDYKSTSPNK
jgi:hypothetical protein